VLSAGENFNFLDRSTLLFVTGSGRRQLHFHSSSFLPFFPFSFVGREDDNGHDERADLLLSNAFVYIKVIRKLFGKVKIVLVCS
jgi:hypothetical protein